MFFKDLFSLHRQGGKGRAHAVLARGRPEAPSCTGSASCLSPACLSFLLNQRPKCKGQEGFPDGKPRGSGAVSHQAVRHLLGPAASHLQAAHPHRKPLSFLGTCADREGHFLLPKQTAAKGTVSRGLKGFGGVRYPQMRGRLGRTNRAGRLPHCPTAHAWP